MFILFFKKNSKFCSTDKQTDLPTKYIEYIEYIELEAHNKELNLERFQVLLQENSGNRTSSF